MSVDAKTIVGANAQVAISGLESKEVPLADEMCSHYSTRGLAGEIQIANGLVLVSNGQDLKSAIGDTPELGEFPLGKQAYKLNRFEQLYRIDRAEKRALQPGAIEQFLSAPYKAVATKIDLTLRGELTAAAKNESQAAGTAWAAANSTPTANMLALGEKVTFGIDTVLIGAYAAKMLATHPEFKETVANYSGRGMSNFEVVRGQVAAILDLDPNRVFIGSNRKYQAVKGGPALSIFDDMFWAGNSNYLLSIHQDDGAGPNGDMLAGYPGGQFEVDYREQEWIQFFTVSRVGQILRATGEGDEFKAAGGFITGIKA